MNYYIGYIIGDVKSYRYCISESQYHELILIYSKLKMKYEIYHDSYGYSMWVNPEQHF